MKFFKKLLSIFTAAILACGLGAMVACGDDNNNDDANAAMEAAAGTYKFQTQSMTDNGVPSAFQVGDMKDGELITEDFVVIGLTADGKMYYKNIADMCMEGTWTIADSVITTTYSNPITNASVSETFTKNGDILTTTSNIPERGIIVTMTFMKKSNTVNPADFATTPNNPDAGVEDDAYVIYVKDASGAPIANVPIGLCTYDKSTGTKGMCYAPSLSGADGKVVITLDEAVYALNDGPFASTYEATETYIFEAYGVYNVVLQAK